MQLGTQKVNTLNRPESESYLQSSLQYYKSVLIIVFESMILILGATADKFMTKSCCGYGLAGVVTNRDCIIIPSLSTEAQKNDIILPFGNFCGQGGLMTKTTVVVATAAKWKTLCSKSITSTHHAGGLVQPNMLTTSDFRYPR
jgi:hypothetical protein